MFASRYPFAKLTRNRALRCAGIERGVVVVTKPVSSEPAEAVHHHSVIIPLPDPRKVLVVEWTGGRAEYHEADL